MNNVREYLGCDIFLLDVDPGKYPIVSLGRDKLANLLDMSIAYTVLTDEGLPIAVIGMVERWTGVFDIYIIPDRTAHDEHKKTFVKSILTMKDEILPELVDNLGIKRLQTVCPYDKLHNRWISLMGFKIEGTMELYGIDGRTHAMWSRLWEPPKL